MSWWSCHKDFCFFQILAPTPQTDLLFEQAEPTSWQCEQGGWNPASARVVPVSAAESLRKGGSGPAAVQHTWVRLPVCLVLKPVRCRLVCSPACVQCLYHMPYRCTAAQTVMGPASSVTWYVLNPFILLLLFLMLPSPPPPKTACGGWAHERKEDLAP